MVTFVFQSAKETDGVSFLDSILKDHNYTSPPEIKELWLHDHNYSLKLGSSKEGCDQGEYLILENDQAAVVHTGITLKTLNVLVEAVQCYASDDFWPSVRSQVLMTLMKLKTNQPLAVLSMYFRTSEPTAVKIVEFWIDVLGAVLRPFVPWLPKQIVRATVPVECNGSIMHHFQGRSLPSAVKYLTAVSPCGLIVFVSAAFAGCRDCAHVPQGSGLLDHLVPGDEVTTRGGFAVKKLLLEGQVYLVVSSLSKIDNLPAATSSPSGNVAHVGKQVESAIQHLMSYKILAQGVPTALLPRIDNILCVCAALTNLRAQTLN
ncbi:uncharacterized protein LOC130918988 isoform X2 [Corythoichthys intestinalis]|uniref:uncharacterized protein LOC130918988 isoform X2 n=1 Tax=Corythoichthys intestinalis TaxID=161448 RepID=UPI0025A5EF99|nr:uncharacterized protein LOC130918988 isoform X2 [Corythoichthys intestinalis]